jgi:hypothetical protein
MNKLNTIGPEDGRNHCDGPASKLALFGRRHKERCDPGPKRHAEQHDLSAM